MPAYRLKVTESRVHTLEVEAFSYDEAESKARQWLAFGLVDPSLRVGVKRLQMHKSDVAVQEARNEEH